MPVWRPFRDHSVSPWRTTKTRGVVIAAVGEVDGVCFYDCFAGSPETEVKQILGGLSRFRGDGGVETRGVLRGTGAGGAKDGRYIELAEPSLLGRLTKDRILIRTQNTIYSFDDSYINENRFKYAPPPSCAAIIHAPTPPYSGK